MHHHRGVHRVESAVSRHEFLATTFLFGGCAEQRHPTRKIVANRCEGQGSAQCGSSDQVVSAGMTDAGQGVVFGKHRDIEITLAETRFEGGGQAIAAGIHVQTVPSRGAYQERGRPFLLESEFGMCMDVVGHREQFRSNGIHCLDERLFH